MNTDKFWSKVNKSPECWIWEGGVNQRGYGFCGRSQKAHRVAWELTFGPIPKGMCVCHACDVRNCVNPDHLFLGTHADNNRDMFAKGRGVNLNGEAHALARLNTPQVLEIRRRALRGNYSALGREFGVSVQHIHRIVTGTAWKHIAKVKDGQS